MKRVELSLRELATFVLRKWYVVLMVTAAFCAVFLPYSQRSYAKQQKQAEITYNQELATYDKDLESYKKESAIYEKVMNKYQQELDKYEKLTAAYLLNMDKYQLNMDTHLLDMKKYLSERDLFDKELSTYQKDLDLYLTEPGAYHDKIGTDNTRIELLSAQKAEILDYLKNSILMTVNPYDYAYGKLLVNVDIEEVNNSILNRVTNHYVELLKGASLPELFRGIVPDTLKESYIWDALTIKRVDNDIVSIEVIFKDDIDSEKMLDAFWDYMKANQELVAETAGDHTLSILVKEVGRTANRSLIDQRNRQKAALAAVEKALIIPEPKRPVAPKLPVEPRQPAEPRQPVEPRNKKPVEPEKPVKAVIRKMPLALGLVAGMSVGVLLTVVLYMLRLPVQYPEQVQRQLKTKFLGRLMPAARPDERARSARLIAENVREASLNCESLLLLSRSCASVGADEMNEIQKALQAYVSKVEIAQDILDDPDAVRKMSEASCVVIVEKLYTSRMRDINWDLERIQYSSAELVGYVIV